MSNPELNCPTMGNKHFTLCYGVRKFCFSSQAQYIVTMKTNVLLGIACLMAIADTTKSQAVFKVLHYTETSGYDHNTRVNSLAMLQSLGASNGFTVDNDTDGSSFDSLSNLQQYAVVVFSNTSGNNILDSAQRANFEAYINGGGSYVGIHAASDTYRHSTANGGNTGTWDWYAEMAGASVQTNPNHVSGTPLYEMSKIGTHPATDSLPDPWAKNEEYYYWQGGYYNAGNIPVLEVEETIGPNGQVNSYDSARPMSWYKYLPGGGRSFYTALGHSNSNYTSDQNFIRHIRDAVLWAAKVSIEGVIESEAGQPVKTATVNLTGEDLQSFTTGADGKFKFDVIKGGDYIITPYKNNDSIVTNGISTADISLIRGHILSNQELSSAYKIIAADVNENNSVSTVDILYMRKTLLDGITAFPNGVLWRFVSSDSIFPNPDNPFPFEQTRIYNNLISNQTDQDFIGIKLGDVNDTWDAGQQ